MSNFLLNPEITLQIADHADSQTIWLLLRLNKSIYRLLTTYQRSIVRSRIKQLVPDSSLRPPLGSLLSSLGPDRRPLAPYSFSVIQELELRRSRTEALLNPRPDVPLRLPPPLVQAMSQIPSYVALPSEKQSRLLELYKTALWMTDRIADLAVTVKIGAAETCRKVPAAGDGHVAVAVAVAGAVEKRIHRVRQEYVKGLKPLELALLSSLAGLCGMAYAREHPQLSADPGYFERVTAFEETVLRQGTFAVWGFLHPDGAVEGVERTAGQQEAAGVPKMLVDGDENTIIDGEGNSGDGAQNGSGGRIRRRSPSHPPRATSGLADMVARRVDEVLKEMEAYESGLNESTVAVDDDVEEREDVYVVLDGLLQTVNGAVARLDLGEEDPEEVLANYPEERIILKALR